MEISDDSTFVLKEHFIALFGKKKECVEMPQSQSQINVHKRVLTPKNREFFTLKRNKTTTFSNDLNTANLLKDIKRSSSFNIKRSDEKHLDIKHLDMKFLDVKRPSVCSKKLTDITETKEYKDIYTANLRLYSSIIAKQLASCRGASCNQETHCYPLMKSRRKSSGINILHLPQSQALERLRVRRLSNTVDSCNKINSSHAEPILGELNNNNKLVVNASNACNEITTENRFQEHKNINYKEASDKSDSFRRNSDLLSKSLRSQSGIERHKLHVVRIMSFDNTIRKTNEFLQKVQTSRNK
ncbi:uncharacterized protein LOC101234820 [Hydra vulgaris]|uniref:Uncharacterized protein LOC101234820 n=1 Tax=Hydra vulgaris TaxID=6087 RepID=A0ABM4BQB0_HYDVU